MNKYKSYECQKCGKLIGWVGRFIEWISFGLIHHTHDKIDTGCICDQNNNGTPTSGWCQTHHTDWL